MDVKYEPLWEIYHSPQYHAFMNVDVFLNCERQTGHGSGHKEEDISSDLNLKKMVVIDGSSLEMLSLF